MTHLVISSDVSPDRNIEFYRATKNQVYVVVRHPDFEDIEETGALDREQARQVRDWLSEFLKEE